jgi:hypothetical protein
MQQLSGEMPALVLGYVKALRHEDAGEWIYKSSYS